MRETFPWFLQLPHRIRRFLRQPCGLPTQFREMGTLVFEKDHLSQGFLFFRRRDFRFIYCASVDCLEPVFWFAKSLQKRPDGSFFCSRGKPLNGWVKLVSLLSSFLFSPWKKKRPDFSSKWSITWKLIATSRSAFAFLRK